MKPLLCTLAVAVAVGTFASSAQAAPKRPVLGAACTKSGSVSATKSDVTVVCARNAKKRLVWSLPALGSALRPVPLGTAIEAGPIGHRFRVRVLQVERNVSPESISEYAVAPDVGFTFMRIVVEVVFAGPDASGTTGHVWGGIDTNGQKYASTTGCGGGYGTDFDVTAEVAKGAALTGTHCLTVAQEAVGNVRLLVDGFGDRPDTYFLLS